MEYLGLDKVEAAKDYESVKPGGYVCRLIDVEDHPEKKYLEFKYDIAEGEYKDYYRKLSAAKGFWGAKFLRSYGEKSLPYFAAFIKAIEASNSGFKFKETHEETLPGKYIGFVLGEEEYENQYGDVKTRLYVARIRTVQQIRSGDFKVPPLKMLSEKKTGVTPPGPETTEDLPF